MIKNDICAYYCYNCYRLPQAANEPKDYKICLSFSGFILKMKIVKGANQIQW